MKEASKFFRRWVGACGSRMGPCYVTRFSAAVVSQTRRHGVVEYCARPSFRGCRGQPWIWAS